MIKNKLFITFLIVLILSFLIFINVSSAFSFYPSDTVSVPDILYTVPDIPDDGINAKYTFIYLVDNEFILYKIVGDTSTIGFPSTFSNGKFNNIYHHINNYDVINCHYNGSDIRVYKYTCSDVSNGWSSPTYWSKSGYSYTIWLDVNYLIYSSDDIYYVDSSGLRYSEDIIGSTNDLFFQKTPNTLGVKLVTAMKVEAILPMVNRLATILIPVGLTVFSAVLLIYLIASRKWRPF